MRGQLVEKYKGLETCGVVWELNRAQKRVLRKKLPLEQFADGFPSLHNEPKPQCTFVCIKVVRMHIWASPGTKLSERALKDLKVF